MKKVPRSIEGVFIRYEDNEAFAVIETRKCERWLEVGIPGTPKLVKGDVVRVNNTSSLAAHWQNVKVEESDDPEAEHYSKVHQRKIYYIMVWGCIWVNGKLFLLEE